MSSRCESNVGEQPIGPLKDASGLRREKKKKRLAHCMEETSELILKVGTTGPTFGPSRRRFAAVKPNALAP